MKARGRIIGSLVVVAAASVVPLWRTYAGPPKEPTALQIMARASTRGARIEVGRNVQVSQAKGAVAHRESVVAADPVNARRLFILAIAAPPTGTSILGYLSD